MRGNAKGISFDINIRCDENWEETNNDRFCENHVAGLSNGFHEHTSQSLDVCGLMCKDNKNESCFSIS